MSEDNLVELSGKHYVLRRLGMSDIFVFNKVVALVLSGGGLTDISYDYFKGEDAGEKFAALLIFGIPFAEDIILKWCLSLIKNYDDEEIYLSDVPAFTEALAKHSEIKSFLEQCKQRLPKILEAVAKARENQAVAD